MNGRTEILLDEQDASELNGLKGFPRVYVFWWFNHNHFALGEG